MDEDQKRHEVCAVEEIPGLYISDWVGASSVNEINILNVTHILSILSPSELEQYGPEETKGVELRHLSLADEASENIIQYFKQECDWLDRALAGGVVLVHCQQGISRSTAIVVAYVMKKFGISLSDALVMIKKARDIVNLNPGFREQLKVWEECQFDIFESDAKKSSSSKKRKEKSAYTAWRKGHGPRIQSDIADRSAEDEPKSATALSPKTPVQEVEVGGVIDFLDTETG